jgi:hypothetical protein
MKYEIIFFKSKDKIIDLVESHKNIPLHTICFNCDKQETIDFMKILANITGGRFNLFNNIENLKHEVY